MFNLFTDSARRVSNSGNVKQMASLINLRDADKPNGSSQAGRRRRAKRALSHGGRTKARIR